MTCETSSNADALGFLLDIDYLSWLCNERNNVDTRRNNTSPLPEFKARQAKYRGKQKKRGKKK